MLRKHSYSERRSYECCLFCGKVFGQRVLGDFNDAMGFAETMLCEKLFDLIHRRRNQALHRI
ncbi:MAG: hypothetical protein ACYYK0_01590 [Candidatus Eutrophobiaceae bacterium]